MHFTSSVILLSIAALASARSHVFMYCIGSCNQRLQADRKAEIACQDDCMTAQIDQCIETAISMYGPEKKDYWGYAEECAHFNAPVLRGTDMRGECETLKTQAIEKGDLKPQADGWVEICIQKYALDGKPTAAAEVNELVLPTTTPDGTLPKRTAMPRAVKW
ncbi:hypothetical protein B0H66DRAFT_9646 [Apodospora peruviana]|uniref:Uncharacterized protein n=1 Tax=Apodospora peruviana TaxID=516989 RepID=A0AAE0ME19_9PEZI|nr:hypothetical protein B0H66DRAFT_9646 [Apodospora peruviana]